VLKVVLLWLGIGGNAQALDHLPQGARLADIAREDPAAPGKTAPIQHQRQRHQRTVVTLLLGVAVSGMDIVFAGAFEKGVGQIEQRDGLLDIEQRTMLPIEEGLDLLAMFP